MLLPYAVCTDTARTRCNPLLFAVNYQRRLLQIWVYLPLRAAIQSRANLFYRIAESGFLTAYLTGGHPITSSL